MKCRGLLNPRSCVSETPHTEGACCIQGLEKALPYCCTVDLPNVLITDYGLMLHHRKPCHRDLLAYGKMQVGLGFSPRLHYFSQLTW